MRRSLILVTLLGLLALGSSSALAATGRVVKVLPQFLDSKGRNSVSPSLYDRDAYQAVLRQYPQRRFGIRYQIEYKARGKVSAPLKVRLELRGIAEGNLPRQLVLEQAVAPTSWFGRFTGMTLGGEQYKQFGEVTAWRVSLWEGDQLLGEQQSFLW